MTHHLSLVFLAFTLGALPASAQTLLGGQDFEGADFSGYTLNNGIGTTDDAFRQVGSDYVLRGSAGTISAASTDAAYSGFNGSNLIGLEDVDGAGYSDPLYLQLDPLNITNAVGISISWRIGASNTLSTRYENMDGLRLEYSIDGGAFVTVGRAVGAAPTGGALHHDANLNGSVEGGEPALSTAMQLFSYDLDTRAGTTVSGTSMVVRIRIESFGPQEAMSFDDIRVQATSVLPVELTSFTGQTSGTEARLIWQTAGETNNSGFEVEHQTDADGPFERVGFVRGAGTTLEAQSYRFTVSSLAPGIHAFRLRQIDLDGAYEYSSLVELSVAPTGFSLDVRPNPAQSAATAWLDLDQAGHASVRVHDSLGRVLAVLHDGTLPSGRHALPLAAELPTGVYFVRAQVQGGIQTSRLVVTR